MKCSGLLYELLSVAKNSKLASTKLCTALKTLHKNKDMDLVVTQKKSSEDCIDQLDFTIRVLMNMLRNLKMNPVLKSKTWRSLCRPDQVRLDMVLERLQLPAELMAGAEVDMEEEKISSLTTVPAPASPLPLTNGDEPMEVSKKKHASDKMKPLPAVFKNIIGGDQCASSAGSTGKAGSTGNAASTETEAKVAIPNIFHNVLADAMKHKPKLSKKQDEKPSCKTGNGKTAIKQGKKATPKKKHGSIKKKKSSTKLQPSPSKKSEGKDSAAVEALGKEYKAGEMMQHRDQWVGHFLKDMQGKGIDSSRADALKEWTTSLCRAKLLQHLSLPELKRRRFISKEATTNPFLERVEKEKHTQ